MLAHPVAVATEDEIEEKVEAIYPSIVGKLIGGPLHDREKSDKMGPSATFAATNALDEAIAPIRDMLRADGADLAVSTQENGTVTMNLIFSDSVCEECILPGKELADMIEAACRESGQAITQVVLHDPREAT